MKKSMLVFCILAFFGMVACTNSDTKSETKSETKDERPESTSSPVEPSKQKDGTTIKVNNDGVSIESKDGEKKNNVSISIDSANIEISRPK